MTSTSALSDLHQQYDGVIPSALLAAVKHGGIAFADLAGALSQIIFFRKMAQSQIKAIRARRTSCTFYPAMLDDLLLYRDQHRAWVCHATAIRQEIAAIAPATRRAA
jgi:hypothetical protein